MQVALSRTVLFVALLTTIIGLSCVAATANTSPLDYHQLILLDAEAMAETGIKEAYEKIRPLLKTYVTKPAEVTEIINNDLPSYSVTSAGLTYDIYSPMSSNAENRSWGRATYALFAIVNNQLKSDPVKFYALNGGNELSGMFLTKVQAKLLRKGLERKTDWPYIPTLVHPWYGQYHDE